MAKKNTYDAESIAILEGLEAVRMRPGMYIGSVSTKGLNHLVYEIVDNAVDEHLAGFCTEIHVTLEKDGSVKVINSGILPDGKRKNIAGKALMDMGAVSVAACATHAVLSGPALERLEESPFNEVVFLNTIPIPEEKKLGKFKILSVAPLFAEAMMRIHTNASISKMFD
jgi:phosphoribosylpyrophosphate synthetase